jgi:hypothetical protein
MDCKADVVEFVYYYNESSTGGVYHMMPTNVDLSLFPASSQPILTVLNNAGYMRLFSDFECKNDVGIMSYAQFMPEDEQNIVDIDNLSIFLNDGTVHNIAGGSLNAFNSASFPIKPLTYTIYGSSIATRGIFKVELMPNTGPTNNVYKVTLTINVADFLVNQDYRASREEIARANNISQRIPGLVPRNETMDPIHHSVASDHSAPSKTNLVSELSSIIKDVISIVKLLKKK